MQRHGQPPAPAGVVPWSSAFCVPRHNAEPKLTGSWLLAQFVLDRTPELVKCLSPQNITTYQTVGNIGPSELEKKKGNYETSCVKFTPYK